MINTIGFICTGTVLIIVVVTKFLAGAWIAILAMGALFAIMKLIHKHYDTVARELEQQAEEDGDDMVLPSRNHAIVLVSKLHLPTMRALAYARATRPDVLEAITVSVDDAETRELVHKWEDSDISVPLKVIASPYREITRPVLDYVKRISKESPRTVVTVFIPEYVVGHWWEQVLHNQSALRLKGRLLFDAECDGDIRSVAAQFVGAAQDAAAACGSGRRPQGLPGLSEQVDEVDRRLAGRTDADHRATGQRRQLRRAPRRPGGVRALRAAGRDGARAGGRRPRILLARRRCRGARTFAGPGRLAVPDRGRGRRRLLRSGVRRTRRGPATQGCRRRQPVGAAGRLPVARRARRGRRAGRRPAAATAGAPGCGSTPPTTAARASTATTALSSSPTCSARSFPTACSTA